MTLPLLKVISKKVQGGKEGWTRLHFVVILSVLITYYTIGWPGLVIPALSTKIGFLSSKIDMTRNGSSTQSMVYLGTAFRWADPLG